MMGVAEVTRRGVGLGGQDVGERGRCLFVVAAAAQGTRVKCADRREWISECCKRAQNRLDARSDDRGQVQGLGCSACCRIY